jgi:hypothetical protein
VTHSSKIDFFLFQSFQLKLELEKHYMADWPVDPEHFPTPKNKHRLQKQLQH